jgi:hypothetical protein
VGDTDTLGPPDSVTELLPKDTLGTIDSVTELLPAADQLPIDALDDTEALADSLFDTVTEGVDELAAVEDIDLLAEADTLGLTD